MTQHRLSGLKLNNQPWIVNDSAAVPSLTVNNITAPTANTAFVVTGTYTNVTPANLAYSSNSTNGSDGTWTTATSPTISGGNYSFTTSAGLAVGTYILWVRIPAQTSVFGRSNVFTVQPLLTPTLTVNNITAPAASTPFAITGTYTNFTMAGLQYSINSTNGSDGTWTAATVSTGSGTYSFTAAGLAVGTYTIYVRRTDLTTMFAHSNAFTISGGTSTAAITQVTPLDSHRVFARDTYVGNPTGFTTTFNKGWGAVTLQINPSASGTLYVALYDAQTSGATTTPATGTLVQAATGVQSVTTGSQTIDLHLPAAVKWYYVDLALNPSMTNALRISTPLGVGAVFGYTGTSHSGAFLGPFAYGFDESAPTPGPWTHAGFPDIHTFPVTISPYGVGWQPSGGTYINVPVYNPAVWALPGDLESPYVTTFGPEFLSRCVSQLGVVTALIGLGRPGGVVKDLDPDRASNLADYLAVYPAIVQALDRTKDATGKWKIDGFILLMPMNDAGFNLGRSLAAKRLKKFADAVNTGCTRQPAWIFTADAAAPHAPDTTRGLAYRQATQDVATALGGATTGAYVMPYNTWGFYQSEHSTMTSRIWMARDFYRSMMIALGTSKGGLSGWGPKVTSATRTGTAITLTVTHDGGTALSGWRYSESSTIPYLIETTTVTNADLVGTVQVYPAGKAYGSNGGTPIALASTNPVQIINGTTIQVNLASDPGSTVGLDVYTASAFETQPSPMTMIVDNQADADGLRGRGLNQNYIPIYVTPPSQPAQSIAVTAPLDTAAGAWMLLKGTGAGTPLAGAGTGLPASSIEVSIGGGAYTVPDSLIITTNNSWSSFVRMPTSIANGVTVQVRRAGQTSPDASTTVNIVAARDTLPSSIKASAVAFYDATNYGTLFQNDATTIPVADLGPIGCWKDALGTAANNVINTGFNANMAKPYFTQRIRSGNIQNNAAPGSLDDPTLDRPAVAFEYANAPNAASCGLVALSPPLGSAVAGDFTVFFTGHIESYNYFFQLGTTGSARLAMDVNGYTRPEVLRAGPNGTGLVAEVTSAPNTTQLRDEYIGRYNASTGMMTLDRTASTGFAAQNTVVGPISDLTAVSNFGPLYIGTNDQLLGGSVRIGALLFFNRRLTDAEVIDLQTWSAARYVAQ